MTTTADEKMIEIKKKVNEIIRLLSDIVIDECYGWNEFSEAYRKFQLDTLNQMIKLRKDLNG